MFSKTTEALATVLREIAILFAGEVSVDGRHFVNRLKNHRFGKEVGNAHPFSSMLSSYMFSLIKQ